MQVKLIAPLWVLTLAATTVNGIPVHWPDGTITDSNDLVARDRVLGKAFGAHNCQGAGKEFSGNQGLETTHSIDASASVFAYYNMKLFDDSGCTAANNGYAGGDRCGEIGGNKLIRCVKIVPL